MKTDWLPALIKIGAVLTAAPRWVGALLAAEGFVLPVVWLPWWIPVSAVLSACMALVEGLAFAYVFESWRNQQDKDSDKLLWLAILSAVIFVAVLAPYIAAQVAHTTLDMILANGAALMGWSIAVGLSTITIVASVGYAQKRRIVRASPKVEVMQPITDASVILASSMHTCKHCGAEFESIPALASHVRWSHAPEKVNGKAH